MPRLQARDESRISTKTAIIIGATIGGIYIIILLILLHIFLQRRLRKQILNEQQRALRTANSHQSTVYLSFHENFASPQSRGTRSFPTRTRTYSEARSYPAGRLNHGSARSAGTLSTIRERPKTRRRGEYEEDLDGENWVSARPQSSSTRTRSGSDTTVYRARPHSSIENPFYMFDGTYGSSAHSSRNNFRRHSYSTISTIARPSHRKSSGLLVPTDVFVSEMNERYPEASVRQRSSSKSMAYIRQVTRSPSPSINDRPPSRTPSQKVLQEIQESDESYLPPVPLDPLIRRKSIERIVSGQFLTPRLRSQSPQIVEIRGKGKGREREKGDNGNEIVRMGTVRRVRELVDVSLNAVGGGGNGGNGHVRNKSLSAINDLFQSMVGRRKSRVSGDTERTERTEKTDKEEKEMRSSIETFSEKM